MSIIRINPIKKLILALYLTLYWALPALAQGYINAPIYATGIVTVAGGTTVTTNLTNARNPPSNFNILAQGNITTWTVNLPTPPFQGQVIAVGCPNGNITNLTVASVDGIAVQSGYNTSCIAGSGVLINFQYSQDINEWIILSVPIGIPVPSAVGNIAVNLSSQCNTAQLNGSSDATACIQAAIDFGFANGIQQVYCPSGSILVTSGPIYQDPPGDLNTRANGPFVLNAVSQSGFSMNFTGLGGPNNVNKGCTVKPTFNTDVAWWIGPGRGMTIRGVNVIGPTAANAAGYRCGQPATAGQGAWHPSGIAISQLASETILENTYVQNFYSGYGIGSNGPSLADSDTFRKNAFNNTCIGFDNTANSQAFIVDIYDPVGSATIAVDSPVGQNVYVYGGNMSATASRSNAFTIGSIGSFTATSPAGVFIYTFNATISGADTYVNTVYNTYNIATADYGVIPLTMTAYNVGTGVATFQITSLWSNAYFPAGNNALSTTTLQTEIAAVTTLYAAEMVTLFNGSNIHVWGGHVENPSAATTLITTSQIFGSTNTSLVQDMYFDAQPTLNSWAPSTNPSPANLAQYYAQTTGSFISVQQPLDLRNLSLGDPPTGGATPGAPLNIDWTSNQVLKLSAQNLTATSGFNSRITAGGYPYGFANPVAIGSQLLGAGFWDTDYFSSLSGSQADSLRTTGFQQSPAWGYRPSGSSRPCLTPSQVTTLTGSLPALSFTTPGGFGTYAVSYPLLWGGQQYQECDWFVGAQTHYNLVSAHHGYSYGQNITSAVASASITASSSTASPYTFSVQGALADGQTYSPTFTIGKTFVVSGATPSTLNGTYTITASSAGSVTATSSTTGTWASGGNALGVMNMQWAAIGLGVVLYVNDTSLFFPGMQVGLTTNSGNVIYMCTGVFPGLGYITVTPMSTSQGVIAGVSGTIYPGTTIAQEPYSITQY